MGVGSLVLSAVVLTFMGFATAVFDYGRQARRAPRQAPVPAEAAAPAAATGSEPQG